MLVRMTLYISTGDGVEGYVAVDLYLGRICRVVLFCMSTAVLGTLKYVAVDLVGNWTIDLYWGRCGRIYRCRSLLGTLW